VRAGALQEIVRIPKMEAKRGRWANVWQRMTKGEKAKDGLQDEKVEGGLEKDIRRRY